MSVAAELSLKEHTDELMSWAVAQLGENLDIRPYGDRDILLAIMGRATLPASDEGAGVDEIIRRMLEAPTVHDAISKSSTSAIIHIMGVPVDVDRPRWFPSSFAGGALAFCVVDAVEVDTGLVHNVVIGSQQPQVAIWRAMIEMALPLRCKFTQSERPTAAGFYPYNLSAV